MARTLFSAFSMLSFVMGLKGMERAPAAATASQMSYRDTIYVSFSFIY